MRVCGMPGQPVRRPSRQPTATPAGLDPTTPSAVAGEPDIPWFQISTAPKAGGGQAVCKSLGAHTLPARNQHYLNMFDGPIGQADAGASCRGCTCPLRRRSANAAFKSAETSGYSGGVGSGSFSTASRSKAQGIAERQKPWRFGASSARWRTAPRRRLTNVPGSTGAE